MKLKLSVCTALLLLSAVFFAVPVFATESGARAAAIANTLERYQVSPDWQPDIKSNYVLLDELYALVNAFTQQDLDTLGGKYDSVKKYYIAYCKAKGISDELPTVYTQSAVAYTPSVEGSYRERANVILSSLLHSNVNHTVQGDIAANSRDIEAMLLLVYEYTDEETEAAIPSERQSMLNYFIGLYEYRGWDITELDLLFTKTMPLIEGIVLPPVVPEKAPTQVSRQNITPIDKPDDVALASTRSSAGFASGLVALLLWLSLLAGLVLFLKQRAEKHFHT